MFFYVHCTIIIRRARMVDTVSVLPFTTEFQVKSGRTGL